MEPNWTCGDDAAKEGYDMKEPKLMTLREIGHLAEKANLNRMRGRPTYPSAPFDTQKKLDRRLHNAVDNLNTSAAGDALCNGANVHSRINGRTVKDRLEQQRKRLETGANGPSHERNLAILARMTDLVAVWSG